MNKVPPQETIALRLINATLSSSEANYAVPFQCLLQFPEPKILLSTFCSILEKTRDPAIKIRVSRLFQDFSIQRAAQDLNWIDDDEFILSCMTTVFVSTPAICSQKDCETFAKFVREMLKLIKNVKVPAIFNRFVRSNSFFAPLAIVILTKNQPKLLHSSIKFIIAMLLQNLEILHIAACALFFAQYKYTALPEAAQNEFNTGNAAEVLLLTIQNSFSQKINFRIAAVELAHSLFQFYQPKESNKLLKLLLPLFISQFKENSIPLRTSIVISLSDFPEIEDDKTFLNSVIPAISSRFDEVDDDFAVACFAFLKHFSTSVFIKPVIINMVNSRDSYVTGVIFSAFLGYFNDDPTLRAKCFPLSPKPMEATAAVMAVNTMGIYKLFTKTNFKSAFDTLLVVLTTPELLDDLFIQFRVFKATDSIVEHSTNFAYIISSSLFEFFPKLKGDDVISHVAPIVDKISTSPEIASLNSADFAPIFVSLMTKYIDDPSIRNMILSFLMLISPNTSTKNHATSDMMLCDLFDEVVPSSFVDAARTEAILKSQSSPRAALIAVALPNCAPYLPTLSRVVRELYPEDSDLTYQFLINGSKRALEAFVPHLMRFTDPVEVSNSYFFIPLSFKGKKRLHLNEVFRCLRYIAHELRPSLSTLIALLSVAEAAFPIISSKNSAKKIAAISEDALNCFIEMSKATLAASNVNGSYNSNKNNVINNVNDNNVNSNNNINSGNTNDGSNVGYNNEGNGNYGSFGVEIKWPVSLLQKIFGFYCFAPSFHLLLRHCPPDVELVATAADSYANFIARKATREVRSSDSSTNFAAAALKCCNSSESLGVLLKAGLKYIEASEDSEALLVFCLTSARILRESKDDIPPDMFDTIVSLAKFSLSNTDRLRILSKDIFLTIFSLKPSADTSNTTNETIKTSILTTMNDDEALAPFSVIEFALQLFRLVFTKFNVDAIVDFALYDVNSRPFIFTNALLLLSLAEQQPQSLVATQKKFLLRFFEVAEQTTKETRVLMHKISNLLAKAEMPIFLQSILQISFTPFLSETISEFVSNDEFRETFFTNFNEIVLSSKLPVSAGDQIAYLSSNFIQAIPVIIQTENGEKRVTGKSGIKANIGNIATYLTVWLAMMFDASPTLKLQKNISEMTNCYDDLFVKVAKCDHEPIEFSLKTAQTLYQSFGTLVGALLITDSETIIGYCESLFALLKSQNQSFVLVASLCISRLFHRLIRFSDQRLIEKLKGAVSLSFVVCCDENCRFLAAVMNDIFNRQLFETFSEEEAANILNGTIRGVTYPGIEMKNESLAFFCKIVVVFKKEVVGPHIDRAWQILNDQDFAPLILSAVSALLEIDNSVKRLCGKITLDRLIAVSVGENGSVPKNARIVLETIAGINNVNNLLYNSNINSLSDSINNKVENKEISNNINNEEINDDDINDDINDDESNDDLSDNINDEVKDEENNKVNNGANNIVNNKVDNNGSNNCNGGAKELDEILKRLRDILQKTEFDETCARIIERVNRSNIGEKILELLLKLIEFEDDDTKFKEKVIALLLSVLEDNEHPLRKVAAEQLTKLLSQ